MKAYLNLLKSDYAVLTFILSAVGFLLLPWVWAKWLMFTLLFTSFDVLGWKWMINGVPWKISSNEDIAAYRIIQHGLFVFILILVAQYDWRISVMVVVSWWTGLCDFLYYIIGKYKFVKDYSWLTGWLWILPVGPLYKANGKPVTFLALVISCIIGLIINAGILWF